MRRTSLVLSINLALAGIVALAALTMAISYWISDRSDSDAYAINLAGSLRMQSYRIALLEQSDAANPAALSEALATFEATWNHPLIQSLRSQNPAQQHAWSQSREFWLQRSQQQQQLPLAELLPQLDQQVEKVEQLVNQIQLHTEANAQKLRLVQVISLFSILALAAVVIYWLRIRMEHPLQQLVLMTRRISQGDFDYRIEPQRTDELGALALTFNTMSNSIAHMHREMEAQIQQQTQALQHSNTTLQFLYDTAKTFIEQDLHSIDYEPILSGLKTLTEIDDIELCFITQSGDTPYRQVKPKHSDEDLCTIRNCDDCRSGEPLNNSVNDSQRAAICRYSFPMSLDQNHFGVLVARSSSGQIPAPWKKQLLQSVADQIAMALSLQAQEDNAQRLSLAHERTVIARELHDSLAQALSYLKIQVARLNRGLAKDDKVILKDVSTELHQGLSSAYQQLRELLTTFRLKVDGPGLLSALQGSVKQLSAQTEMQIGLDYHLESLPLTPNEEIHLLQIVREAVQNALHHSNGTRVDIQLQQHQQRICVSISDDGIGVAEQPHKLDHYGLAIMQERSKNLNGELSVDNAAEGGTCVTFSFKPDCLTTSSVFARGG